MVQSITVTGLGCSTFEDAMSTLKEIHLIAEREFKYGMLDKWSPGMYCGFSTLMFSNRYFCTIKDRDYHEEVAFSKDIDPIGILQCLTKNDLVHTEENEVQYFKSSIDEEGKRRYEQAH